MTKYEIGKIYDTAKGKIKIHTLIAGKRLPDGKRIHPRAVIEFIKTGTVTTVQTTNIAQGKISDFREPTVYGVGFIGSDIRIPDRGNSVIRRIYDLWCNMLKRAYGGYKSSYKDVSVDTRWHNFTNFLNTVQELEFYEEWESGKGFVLDKDTVVRGNKIYSKETCRFIPSFVNESEGSNRRWHGTNDPMLTN